MFLAVTEIVYVIVTNGNVYGSYQLEKLFMQMLHTDVCMEASSQRNCLCKCYMRCYMWKVRVRGIVYVNVTHRYMYGS
jgi:hypothetical protein